MSEQPTDGGPAFPVHGGHHPDDDPRNQILGGGMSLRDWFAGQAMAGILANVRINAADGGYSPAMAAADAFTTADAMLAARGRDTRARREASK